MANTAPEIKCPVCRQGLDIDEWMTEYGDPVEGECLVTCPECNKRFILDVKITITYSSKKVKYE